MQSISGRSLSFVATLLLLFTLSAPTQAALVETLVPYATDLSNVHVGDTLHFLTIGSSDADPNEHLTVFPNVHLFSAGTADFDIFSGVGLIGWDNPLGTNPYLVLWTIQASTAGTVDLFNGWSDCLGLPDDTFGCAVTNLGATRPADSNHITFVVNDVPEPSSIALLAAGLLVWGCRRRNC